MDRKQDEGDDFFQAFLHSLRSSCFQFLEFQEHVNIRGFVSVEVDGQDQRHLVLAETVARGSRSVTGSFPLQTLTSSSTSQGGSTRRTSLPPRAASQSSKTNPPIQKINRTLTGTFTSRGRADNRPPTSHSPEPPRFFLADRSGSTNTTFTLDSRRSLGKKASSTSANRGPSTTTINVSPSKSHLKRRDAAGRGRDHSASNSSSFAKRNLSEHTIILNTHQLTPDRDNDSLLCCDLDSSSGDNITPPPKQYRRAKQDHFADLFDTSFSKRSRKRVHKSSPASCSPCSMSMSLTSCEELSAMTCPDMSRLRGLSTKEHRRKRDKTGKKSKHVHQSTKEKGRLKSSKRHNNNDSPNFSSFFEPSSSTTAVAAAAFDQECRITAVKPYYLVNHNDDTSSPMNIGSRTPSPQPLDPPPALPRTGTFDFDKL